MKHIAILGAGFAGLACAYFLSLKQKPNAKITVFDPLHLGKGTSGIAAGLLHAYTGAHAHPNRFAREGLQETLALLTKAQEVSPTSFFWKTGIFRPPRSPIQEKTFRQRAQKFSDVDWCMPKYAQEEGLWIQQGYVVDCPTYIKSLALLCQQQGVHFVQQKIDAESSLDAFDCVIGALGEATPSFPPFAHLPLKRTKGQLLIWENSPLSLPFPINAEKYLLQIPQTTTFVGGATFEHEFSSIAPDIEQAKRLLLPSLSPLLPPLAEKSPSSCRTGVRLSTHNHTPLVGHVKGKYWVLTAFGSKGLLYHALFAKKLMHAMDDFVDKRPLYSIDLNKGFT